MDSVTQASARRRPPNSWARPANSMEQTQAVIGGWTASGSDPGRRGPKAALALPGGLRDISKGVVRRLRRRDRAHRDVAEHSPTPLHDRHRGRLRDVVSRVAVHDVEQRAPGVNSTSQLFQRRKRRGGDAVARQRQRALRRRTNREGGPTCARACPATVATDPHPSMSPRPRTTSAARCETRAARRPRMRCTKSVTRWGAFGGTRATGEPQRGPSRGSRLAATRARRAPTPRPECPRGTGSNGRSTRALPPPHARDDHQRTRR